MLIKIKEGIFINPDFVTSVIVESQHYGEGWIVSIEMINKTHHVYCENLNEVERIIEKIYKNKSSFKLHELLKVFEDFNVTVWNT